MIDYEILRLIWWLFIGVLLVGFAIMDGQDMGVGSLLPFLGKNDTDRRCMINSVAPHWTATRCGCSRAAAPSRSLAASVRRCLLGLLLGHAHRASRTDLRPVGFDFRGKMAGTRWRNTWDWALFVGSAVPRSSSAVAFGNLLQGVPFHFDDRCVRSTRAASSVCSIRSDCCGGVVSLLMIVFHGANYLVLRTDGDLQRRAMSISTISGVATAALFILGGIWTYFGIDGMVVSAGLDPAGPSNPLLKTVDIAAGAWFTNFSNYPVLWLVPVLAVLGAFGGVFFAKQMKGGMAIVCSSVMLLGIILTPLLSMFRSSCRAQAIPRSSLTIWDCTSSQLTLEVMLFVTLLLLPLVLIYTGWAYRTMSGKLNAEYIRKNNHDLY